MEKAIKLSTFVLNLNECYRFIDLNSDTVHDKSRKYFEKLDVLYIVYVF